MDSIKLECKCGNRMNYDREIDPDVPANVARIVSQKCPRCDDGDFGIETWFDAAGKEVRPSWA